MDGFRSGLDDEEFTALPVLCPFDVHRHRMLGPAAIMIFYRQRLISEREDFFIGKTRLAPLSPCGFDQAHPTSPPDHSYLLGPNPVTQDGPEAFAICRLVDQKFIWIGTTLHDRLAKAQNARHHDYVRASTFGFQGEDDAGRPLSRIDHLLHRDGDRNLFMIEALGNPVGNGALCIEGREATPDRAFQRGPAMNVQHAFMQARKGCPRQILGGCAAAHSNGTRFLQLAVGIADGLGQAVGPIGPLNHGTQTR